MEPKDAKRVIDFVVGVAINGDVQKVRDSLYLFACVNFHMKFWDEMAEAAHENESRLRCA